MKRTHSVILVAVFSLVLSACTSWSLTHQSAAVMMEKAILQAHNNNEEVVAVRAWLGAVDRKKIDVQGDLRERVGGLVADNKYAAVDAGAIDRHFFATDLVIDATPHSSEDVENIAATAEARNAGR